MHMYVKTIYILIAVCLVLYIGNANAVLQINASASADQIRISENLSAIGYSEVNYSGSSDGIILAGIGFTVVCEGSNAINAHKANDTVEARAVGLFDFSAVDVENINGNYKPSGWDSWRPGYHACTISYSGSGAFESSGGVNVSFSFQGAGASFTIGGGSVPPVSDSDSDDFRMYKPLQLGGGCGCGCSPILLDQGPEGFDLTGLDNPVFFDINADQSYEIISWTQEGDNDAFLVLDNNLNGVIESGRELFGNSTLLSNGLLAEHGYQALNELDQDGSGKIDGDDDFYWLLELWVDKNHNGITEHNELASLWDKGVISISVDYEIDGARDEHGNFFAYSSSAELCANESCSEIREIKTTDVFFIGRTINLSNKNDETHDDEVQCQL